VLSLKYIALDVTGNNSFWQRIATVLIAND
jgi:hypothetical protein